MLVKDGETDADIDAALGGEAAPAAGHPGAAVTPRPPHPGGRSEPAAAQRRRPLRAGGHPAPRLRP